MYACRRTHVDVACIHKCTAADIQSASNPPQKVTVVSILSTAILKWWNSKLIANRLMRKLFKKQKLKGILRTLHRTSRKGRKGERTIRFSDKLHVKVFDQKEATVGGAGTRNSSEDLHHIMKIVNSRWVVTSWTYLIAVVRVIEVSLLPIWLAFDLKRFQLVRLVCDLIVLSHLCFERLSKTLNAEAQSKIPIRLRPSHEVWMDLIAATTSWLMMPIANAFASCCSTGVADLFFGIVLSTRLIHAYQLYGFFRRRELDPRTDVQKLAVLKFVSVIILTAHYSGCFWLIVARAQSFGRKTWTNQLSRRGSCPEQGEWGSIRSDDDKSESGCEDRVTFFYAHGGSATDEYLAALYFGFHSLTNLGYDGILPENLAECFYALFMTLIQVGRNMLYLVCCTLHTVNRMFDGLLQMLVYAYLFGTILHYLVKRDEVIESFKRRLVVLADRRRLAWRVG